MNTTDSYYNTTYVQGEGLKKNIRQANSQTEKILEFFKKNPDREFTPFDIEYNQVLDDNTPITSIRRSITNLEKDGKLEKTPIQREGAYGRPNYCWKLFVPKKPEFVQETLFK